MKKICLPFGLAIAVLLTGCASYQSSSLSALDPQCVRIYPEIDGVAIGCKAYSLEDCYTYLDRDVIAKGYQPIQLTFQNLTDKHYVFSTSDINLPCVNAGVVASTVHTSTLGRAAGYSGVGLLAMSGVGFIAWPLFIPAVVDGIKSSSANASLDNDFYNKAKDHVVINPHSFAKTLVFIPRAHFSPIFDITLLEEETGKHKTVGLSVIR